MVLICSEPQISIEWIFTNLEAVLGISAEPYTLNKCVGRQQIIGIIIII